MQGAHEKDIHWSKTGPAEAILSEKYKIFFAPAIFLHFGY
jgi:hypothetical protein